MKYYIWEAQSPKPLPVPHKTILAYILEIIIAVLNDSLTYPLAFSRGFWSTFQILSKMLRPQDQLR